MSALNERDQALAILDSKLTKLSKLYRDCYLAAGKGALLVHAKDVIEVRTPSMTDYRIREEMLELFDTPRSQAALTKMIDNYEPQKEGIMSLITSFSNATYFITIKLK